MLEQSKIALPPKAEPKIVTDDKNSYTETLYQDFLYVAIGTQAANLFIEIKLKHKIDPETFQQLQLFTDHVQARRWFTPRSSEKFFRMRLQQNNQCWQIQLFCPLLQLIKNKLVPQMYSVKLTDGSNTALVKLRKPIRMVEDDHSG